MSETEASKLHWVVMFIFLAAIIIFVGFLVWDVKRDDFCKGNGFDYSPPVMSIDHPHAAPGNIVCCRSHYARCLRLSDYCEGMKIRND